MSVLTDIKNRGVKDSFFLVCDGLKGLPEVVANVWPLTTAYFLGSVMRERAPIKLSHKTIRPHNIAVRHSPGYVRSEIRQVTKKHAEISSDRVLPLHGFPAACGRFVNIRRVEAIHGRFQVMRRQGSDPPLRHRLRIAAHAVKREGSQTSWQHNARRCSPGRAA